VEGVVRLKVSLESFKLNENFSLRGISFELRRGEALSLLGASGSGKTTLLKVIDGLYKNYRGSILLDGKEIRELKPREIYAKMGLLFQNPEEQLFAETVFEDVSFGPRNMGFKEEEIEKAVKKALELLRLSGFEKRKISNLSFGEKKRVALAGLLAMGQEILLLDEPTLGLDPLLEKEFLELLLSLKKKGFSFIMATHQVDLVPYFADKVVVLKEGEMAFYGTPRELFTGEINLKELNLRPPVVTQVFAPFKIDAKRLPLTLDEAIFLLKTYLKDLELYESS